MPESGIMLVSFFGVRPYSLENSVDIVRTYAVQNIKKSTGSMIYHPCPII